MYIAQLSSWKGFQRKGRNWICWFAVKKQVGKKFAHFGELEFVRNYQYLKMERVLPSPELNKAYREFSRQRYPQLMASSRLMRETDAVQAIIREWEGLSPAERLTFLPAPFDPLATPARDRPLHLKKESNAKTTGQKPPSEQGEQQEQDPQSPSRPRKVKRIARSDGRRNYITFYRFHHQRLMEIHPNWESKKISVIIGLKWRKEKMEVSRANRAKQSVKNTHRPKISGRRLFRMAMGKHGLDCSEIIGKWKRLPSDSKRMWQRRGDPSAAMEKSVQSRMVKLGGQESGELMQLMGRK